jgi:phenylacetate-CoA ligase
MRNGAALRADTWAGWRLGQPMGAVWGNPPPPRDWRARLRGAVKDRVVCLDTMHLDGAAVDRFAREWSALRPGLLYGHAHSLYLLAEILAARGGALRPQPRAIVATSMMLLRSEREVIERVIGVPVTDRYGCEELGLIACECEVHAGLHVNAELVAVEVLREDGAPCAPGEVGRIVVTDLVNYGQPLLRYEVGDRGAFAAAACSCGRGLPLLERLAGRTADFLVAADGTLVAGISLIENTLTRFSGIRQMQLVQEARDLLVVNLVRADGWSEETSRAVAETFRGALGSALRVEFRLVEKIPQEPSGKYRFAICRVRP